MKEQKIKVIIMDIDGTLVGRDGVITMETKETLCEAQEQGIRLVLASGRPINGMVALAKELEMAQPFEGELNSMFTAPFYYEFTAKGIAHSLKKHIKNLVE